MMEWWKIGFRFWIALVSIQRHSAPEYNLRFEALNVVLTLCNLFQSLEKNSLIPNMKQAHLLAKRIWEYLILMICIKLYKPYPNAVERITFVLVSTKSVNMNIIKTFESSSRKQCLKLTYLLHKNIEAIGSGCYFNGSYTLYY